jgi:protein TonB
MTQSQQPRIGGRQAADRPEHGRVVDLLGAVVPARVREPVVVSTSDSDLSNVVPFAPRRRESERQAPALSLAVADRPCPWAHLDRRERIALLVAASFAIHASVFAAFNREPPPLASVGVVSISAELVLGADAEAGQSQQKTESEISSAAAPVTDEPEAKEPEKAREADEAAQTAPQAAPEAAAAVQEPPQPQTDPEIVAAPKKAEKPTVQAKLAEPEEKVTPKPHRETAPHSRDKGKNERTRSTPASAASLESNSVGRGRSDADTNYRGVVAAHLARYKQFPADARSRGDHGTATISFSLDGSGRVTSARLVRGSGVASLDQETQAMVRRASPFPAPPSGRPMTFTVPISFNLR